MKDFGLFIYGLTRGHLKSIGKTSYMYTHMTESSLANEAFDGVLSEYLVSNGS